MLVITGYKSAIARELVALAPEDEWIEPGRTPGLRTDGERYLFAQGFLAGKAPHEISAAEKERTRRDNFEAIAADLDRLMAVNPTARAVVIGSESGFAGSYDEDYALAKAQLARYVEDKRLMFPEQQLVCVAPSIVADAGMTLRRQDADRLNNRRRSHPKLRFVTAAEVARVVHYVLYQDSGYLSGTTIRLHGGAPAWAW